MHYLTRVGVPRDQQDENRKLLVLSRLFLLLLSLELQMVAGQKGFQEFEVEFRQEVC